MRDNTKSTKTTKHIFCAHCGTQNPTDDYACSRCGERLTGSTIDSSSKIEYVACSQCLNTNDVRSDYCWVCGAEMSLSVPLANTPNIETPSTTQTQIFEHDINRAPGSSTDFINPQNDLTNAEQALETGSQEQSSSPDEGISAPNTSGRSNGEIPPAINRWNWAAFLMPAVWGLFSGVPFTGLLFAAAFLPSSAQLLIMIIASLFLGFKGNQLAWRGKKWQSVEHFHSFQQKWASWSIKLSAAIGAILIIFILSQSSS